MRTNFAIYAMARSIIGGHATQLLPGFAAFLSSGSSDCLIGGSAVSAASGVGAVRGDTLAILSGDQDRFGVESTGTGHDVALDVDNAIRADLTGKPTKNRSLLNPKAASFFDKTKETLERSFSPRGFIRVGGSHSHQADTDMAEESTQANPVSQVSRNLQSSCNNDSECTLNKRCKGDWNMNKHCRTKGDDCKTRGTRRKTAWGCTAGKTCHACGANKWAKCSSSTPAEALARCTSAPTDSPTGAPTKSPTAAPSEAPTNRPTGAPTTTTTDAPSKSPSTAPSFSPTESPTTAPTSLPTESPTASPSSAPTGAPTSMPTDVPTALPTVSPTKSPTTAPTSLPTESPTASPSSVPTGAPTTVPTESPTGVPSSLPTGSPTASPSASPTAAPDPHVTCHFTADDIVDQVWYNGIQLNAATGLSANWEKSVNHIKTVDFTSVSGAVLAMKVHDHQDGKGASKAFMIYCRSEVPAWQFGLRETCTASATSADRNCREAAGYIKATGSTPGSGNWKSNDYDDSSWGIPTGDLIQGRWGIYLEPDAGGLWFGANQYNHYRIRHSSA